MNTRSHLYFDDLETLFKRECFRPTLIDRSLRPRAPRDGPKTLICRDERGGYLDVDIEQTVAIAADAQLPFVHCFWGYTDIFVYFTHHFITIPTVRWTNAAHDHDVCMLGTFITESASGQALCTAILSNEHKLGLLISHLVELCEYVCFISFILLLLHPH